MTEMCTPKYALPSPRFENFVKLLFLYSKTILKHLLQFSHPQSKVLTEKKNENFFVCWDFAKNQLLQ